MLKTTQAVVTYIVSVPRHWWIKQPLKNENKNDVCHATLISQALEHRLKLLKTLQSQGKSAQL